MLKRGEELLVNYKYKTKPKEQVICISAEGGAVLVWAVSIVPPRYDRSQGSSCSKEETL